MQRSVIPAALASPFLFFLAAGCSGGGDEAAVDSAAGGAGPVPAGVEPAQGPLDTGPELGFAVWHRDFPGAPHSPHLSPRVPGGWYDRNRTQALEKLVANLRGACSKDAWHFAKEVFGRLPDEAHEVLVTALDRAFQSPAAADVVENTAEAIGRSRNPALAPALLRALEHPKESVRNKAMRALIGAGTADAVRQAQQMLPQLELRAQNDWIRAAHRHLGAEAVPVFRYLLTERSYYAVRPTIYEVVLEMPVDQAAEVIDAVWPSPPDPVRASCAGILHANGVASGTIALREMLDHPDPIARSTAIAALQIGRKEVFLERLMKLSLDPDPSVRGAVAQSFADVDGENVDGLLETLSQDDVVPVRQAALAALVARGKTDVLEDIVRELKTATGTRFNLLIGDVVAAKYAGAIPVLEARMRELPAIEWRPYLQSISFMQLRESFAPLERVFLAPEEQLSTSAADGRGLSTHEYASLIMGNCRGAEDLMLAMYSGIPREDYRRRAYAIKLLGSVAVDREDPALADQVYEILRGVVLDREEIPQLRLHALELLRRGLTLDDALRIKRQLERESEPMRKALSDFLYEFF